MISEREVSQALAAGLAGVAAFRWGWHAMESAWTPPALPVVTLTRLSSDVESVADMCRGDNIVGATTLETHAWAAGYEDARLLQDQVRAVVVGTGWNLTGEQDAYDAVFRAWRISAQWVNVGPLAAS